MLNIDFKPFILIVRDTKSANCMRGASQIIKDTMVKGYTTSLRRNKCILEYSSTHHKEKEKEKKKRKLCFH